MLPVLNAEKAIKHNSKRGPTFGEEGDLELSDDFSQETSTMKAQGTYAIPAQFNYCPELLNGKARFACIEVEVYQLRK